MEAQFAGYYAAIEKGYYAAVGLDVKLKANRPGSNIVDELLAGRANYGIDMSNLLLERQKGKPVVVLAAILQHSPEALFVRKDSGIINPHDLIGKTIMLWPKADVEVRAMLLKEGSKTDQINITAHSWNINDLIALEGLMLHPGRWQHIGDTFVKLGMLKPDYSLSGFIYNPTPRPDYTKVMRIVWIMLIVVISDTNRRNSTIAIQ